MDSLSEHPVCESCGASLPAPGVACDRCLMRRALELPDSAPLGPGFLDDLPMAGEADVIVGKYTILGTVARGGMGVVYRARQAELNRTVALKMLLGGAHAGDACKKRFLQEAQAAARLNHPAIVKILDWGEDRGQPFFAMEFIEGADLGAKTRGQPLPARRAAEIVLTLAGAIEYAHGQGVLHRDLKPSNVLLDAQGAPRITDFGLAKQLDQEQSLTRSGDLLGTPGYLPPEQASSRFGTVGVRSDVYGLGGILYALLTGRPPFVAGSATEVLRAVAEQEPPGPRQLNASVPADLETICLKCLEKETSRRYPSARALAEDLQRFLAHEPVHARPASAIYKTRKWVEKNRFPAAFAAVAILALILGTAVAWRQAIRAGHARTKAQSSERTARVETAKSREMTAFLKELLGGITPDHALGRDTALLKEMLALAATRADTTLTNQPEVEAEVREVMAATSRQLALLDDAVRHAERALALREQLSGAGHPATLTALNEVALASFERGELERAEKLLQRALEIGGTNWKPDDPERLRVLMDLARVEIARGNYSGAEPRLLSVLEMQKRSPGPDAPPTLRTERAYVSLLQARGLLSEAARRQNKVVEAYRRQLPADAPETLQALAEHAALKVLVGEAQGASMLYQTVLEQQQRTLGREHHHALRTQGSLALLYGRMGRSADGERLLRETLAALKRSYGDTHPDTLAVLGHLGGELMLQDRFTEAAPLVRDVLAAQGQKHGQDHAAAMEANLNLARVRLGLKQPAQAQAIFRDVWQRSSRVLGTNHVLHLTALRQLAVVTADLGDLSGAEKLLREAVAAHQRALAAKHRETLLAASQHARVLSRLGRTEEAATLLRETLALQESSLSTIHPETVASTRELAAIYTTLGRTNEAHELEVKLAGREQRSGSAFAPGATGMRLGNLAYARADQLLREGKFAEAEPMLRMLVVSQLKSSPPTNEVVLSLRASLGRVLSEWAWAERGTDEARERAREAEQILGECVAVRERGPNSPRWRLPDTRSRHGFAQLAVLANEDSPAPESRATRLVQMEKLLLDGANALDAESSVTISYRREAATRLLRLYEFWPKPGPAARWQERVDALK